MTPSLAKCVASNGFAYSERCTVILQGAAFDARQFIARPRRTNDPDADEALLRTFKAKVKMMDILQQRPDLCDATLSFAEDRANGFRPVARGNGTRKGEVQEEEWNTTYMQVWKLPKYWRLTELVKHFASIGMTEDLFVKADRLDSESISDCFDYLAGVNGSMKLPMPCTNTKVCSLVFKARMDELQRATKDWVKKAFNTKTGAFLRLSPISRRRCLPCRCCWLSVHAEPSWRSLRT